MSTSTWNPERRFPWLGDSLPCPTPEEEAAERVVETSRLWGPPTVLQPRFYDPAKYAALAAEDRAATVRLYGEERVAELEREANRG